MKCTFYNTCIPGILNLYRFLQTGKSVIAFRKQWKTTERYYCLVNHRPTSKTGCDCNVLGDMQHLKVCGEGIETVEDGLHDCRLRELYRC